MNSSWFAGATQDEHDSGGRSGCTYMTMTCPCQAFLRKIVLHFGREAGQEFPEVSPILGASHASAKLFRK